ncbi:MAG: aminotransferase class I/II-fold pyridoxal phosphate-dependent enzyme [Hungatella sp.]|jgi:3-amino-5-hydroxybenzoate synthase|nr:aminotransferase class I/II-fold pyridoxal phosphate-dependent enzyme [Hungatella sp.]
MKSEGTKERKEYFESLWPPRDEILIACVTDAIQSGKWSRISDNDWRESYCGRFEKLFAKYVSARYALCLENGTRALELCLRALDLKPGDEVIVPACSFVATATAVSFCGGIPVMVDVREKDLNINPEEIKKAITDRTKGIIVVHLGGMPCNMDEILRITEQYHLFLLEDCSHTHGSEWKGQRVGTFGDFGVFSLQQGKLLTSGEGAVAVCGRKNLYNRLFSVHQFYSSMPVGCMNHYVPVISTNGRMTNYQGAMLFAQMREIEKTDLRRLEGLNYLLQVMKEIPGIEPVFQEGTDVSRYFGYYISFRYDKTSFGGMSNIDFTIFMSRNGYPFFKGHNFPMYEREPYASDPFLYRKLDCPVAEEYAQNCIVNIRHEILMAEKDVIDEMILLIKYLGGKNKEYQEGQMMDMDHAADFLHRFYGCEISKIQIIKLLDQGWDNQNYLIEMEKRRFVFRKYLLTDRESVKQELELIKLLNKLDFPTFRVIRNIENAAVTEKGEDTYILYQYIESERAAQIQDMEKIVELVQKLHVLAYGFNMEASRNRYKGIEREFIRYIKENEFEKIANMDALIQFTENWMEKEQAVLLEKEPMLRKTWVHHDLNPGNLLVSPDGRINLIDFDECLYTSFLVDIASLFHYWCLAENGESFDRNLAETILAKYHSLTPLTAVEMELLPYLTVQYQLEDTLFFIKRELEEDKDSIKDVLQSYSFHGLMLLYGMLKEGRLNFRLQ